MPIIKELMPRLANRNRIASWALVLFFISSSVSALDNILRTAVVDRGYAKLKIPELVKYLKDKDPYTREVTFRILWELGENAAPALPHLIEALDHKDVNTVSLALYTIGEIGEQSHTAVSKITKLLKHSDSNIRKGAAETLGKIGPGAKSAIPVLIEALDDEDIAVKAFVARSLIKSGDIDQKQLESILKKFNESNLVYDRCVTFCKLVDTIRNELLKNLQPDNAFKEIPFSYKVVLDRLDTLFVLKAVSLCPSQENKSFVMNALDNLSRSTLSTSTEKAAKNENFSSLKIYDSQFKMQIIKEFIARKIDFKLNESQLNALIKNLNNETNISTEYFGRLEGFAGSAMTSYAQACQLIHLKAGRTDIQCKATEEAQSQLRKAIEIDPLKIPYAFDPYHAHSTPKSSAARAVPANMAIYLLEPDTDVKQKKAQGLYLAIKNYFQHKELLIAHTIFYPETHNPAQGGIAPYYFYSTIPYTMSAIKILEKEKSLSPGQQKDLTLIYKDLSNLLFQLVDNKKNQMMPHSPFYRNNGMYPSSPRYVTALGGLALVPVLAQECGEKKESLGILSNVDVLGLKYYYNFFPEQSSDSHIEKPSETFQHTLKK